MELGRSHVALPVTQRWTKKPSVLPKISVRHKEERGLWLYYARGCNDLQYSVGRTIAARNKAHAALKLASMVNGSSKAAARVANFLRAGPFASPKHFKPRYANALHHMNVTLESVLEHAAFGPFAMVRNQRYASMPFCDAEFMRLSGGNPGAAAWLDTFVEERRQMCVDACALAELVAVIVIFEFLDGYLLTTGRGLGLDSIQLLMQPQATASTPTRVAGWSRSSTYAQRFATLSTSRSSRRAYLPSYRVTCRRCRQSKQAALWPGVMGRRRQRRASPRAGLRAAWRARARRWR